MRDATRGLPAVLRELIDAASAMSIDVQYLSVSGTPEQRAAAVDLRANADRIAKLAEELRRTLGGEV